MAASAQDSQNNVASVNTHFVIDKTPPLVTISGVEDGQILKCLVHPTFSVSDKNLQGIGGFLESVGSGEIKSYPQNGFSIEGIESYNLVVSATDKAGNLTIQTASFEIIENNVFFASFDNSLEADFSDLGNYQNLGGGSQVTGFSGNGVEVEGESQGLVYQITNSSFKGNVNVSFRFQPAWTEANKPDAHNYIFLLEGNPPGNQKVVAFYITADGRTHLDIVNTAGQQINISTKDNLWTSGQFHFVEIRWDEATGTASFRVNNGKTFTQTVATLDVRSPLQKVVLGSSKGSSLKDEMQGIIDEVKINSCAGFKEGNQTATAGN